MNNLSSKQRQKTHSLDNVLQSKNCECSDRVKSHTSREGEREDCYANIRLIYILDNLFAIREKNRFLLLTSNGSRFFLENMKSFFARFLYNLE